MLIMNKIVGNKLKQLRKSKNLSQEQVADYLCISQSAYARMERGESTSWAGHFNRICEVFEISPEELVTKKTEIFLESSQVNEIAMFLVYRQIIKEYELQIEDLKTIIKHLNRGKN